MDGAGVLKNVTASLEGRIATAEREIRRLKQDMRDMPTRMQSRYDTSREETSVIVDALVRKVIEFREALRELGSLNPPPGKSVGIGSLVRMMVGGQRLYVFLVPSIGGERLIVDDETVVTVTQAAPLGAILMNREEGEAFSAEINGQERAIVVDRVLQCRAGSLTD